MSAQLQAAIDVGIRSRVPWDEYITIEGTSISRLKELRRSPQHYAYRLEHPKESPAMALGTAAHTAVLEPERFSTQFAVWTRRSEKTGNLCPRNGQFYEAFELENPGKTIITADEFALATQIAAAVRTNPIAMRYLERGDPEVTMQWLIGDGHPCRARADWLTRVDDVPHVVGLKTARDCRLFKFGHQAAVLGYHLQWGFYYDGFMAIKKCEPRMIEIVVESEPPHAVAVYSIPQDIIDQGRDEYQALMLRLAECESTGHFPGPQEAEEPLSLPSWVYGETTDDLTELGLEQ
jgi:hypothetical protein